MASLVTPAFCSSKTGNNVEYIELTGTDIFVICTDNFAIVLFVV